MQHTGGKMNPPVRSKATIMIKTEPTSPREPKSPTLSGDVPTLEEAHCKHQNYIHHQTVYTSKTSNGSTVDIASTSTMAE